MGYKREFVSSIMISIIVVLGFFMLMTNQATAQEDECRLSITKVAIPADDTVFTFIGSGDDDFSFDVSDPSDPTTGGGIEIGATLIITEQLPPGWELANIECTEGTEDCSEGGGFEPCLRITIDEATNSITAFCDDLDTGSCTFTNTRIAASSVPTLSEWGLIAMAGVLGIVGFMVIRRRQATA